MIKDKTYDIYGEEKRIPPLRTLKEYNDEYITDIYMLLHKHSVLYNCNPCLVLGLEIRFLIEETSIFIDNVVYDNYIGNGNMVEIGTLSLFNVYYDNRLKNNQVIIGDNKSELSQYIRTKHRKQKLKKLND